MVVGRNIKLGPNLKVRIRVDGKEEDSVVYNIYKTCVYIYSVQWAWQIWNEVNRVFGLQTMIGEWKTMIFD